MHLDYIDLKDFGRLGTSFISFSSQLNIITGTSGTGKSQLLSLVRLLDTFKSGDRELDLETVASSRLKYIAPGKKACRVRWEESFNFQDLFSSVTFLSNSLGRTVTTRYEREVFMGQSSLLKPDHVFVYNCGIDLNVPDSVHRSKRICGEVTNRLYDELVSSPEFRNLTTNSRSQMCLIRMAGHILTRTFSEGTKLIWDTPEQEMDNLSLRFIARMLYKLSLLGVQVFIATHSLFLLRELEIIVRSESGIIIPRVLNLLEDNKGGVKIEDGFGWDSVDNISCLDEELKQSDRYMDTV